MNTSLNSITVRVDVMSAVYRRSGGVQWFNPDSDQWETYEGWVPQFDVYKYRLGDTDNATV